MSSVKSSDITPNGSSWSRPDVDWPALLNRVQHKEKAAVDELYSLISKGVLFFLQRRLSKEQAEDRLHDVFLILLRAIEQGCIENANAFPAFSLTVTKRQYFAEVRDEIKRKEERGNEFFLESLPAKTSWDPHKMVEDQQRSALLTGVLASMDPARRDILKRFYLLDQSQEQICSEMKLTVTQFRLLKSRAKAQFGELGRKKLDLRSWKRKWERSSLSSGGSPSKAAAA